jgi:aldehyde:ferredoxin oxidoreductase
MRVYINRQGITAEDDHWPEIYYEEPGLAGEDKSPPFSRTQFQKELDRYYKIRGWDSYTGKPLPETLKKLGIDLEEE